MRTKQITRIRGTTLKVGVKSAYLKALLKQANQAMLSVANFNAEDDSAQDYRACLDPIYNDLADLLQELHPTERPAIYRGRIKIFSSELFGLKFELLHAAGYAKIHFNARIESKVQTIVINLHPEGRQPAVPALMRKGKLSAEKPEVLF